MKSITDVDSIKVSITYCTGVVIDGNYKQAGYFIAEVKPSRNLNTFLKDIPSQKFIETRSIRYLGETLGDFLKQTSADKFKLKYNDLDTIDMNHLEQTLSSHWDKSVQKIRSYIK